MRSRLLSVRVGVLCAVLAAAFGAAGCKDSGIVKRVEAGGTVTLDGKPFSVGRLEFVPDVTKGNSARVSCSAAISNGRFNLNTVGVNAGNNGSGAPVGWFKVKWFNPNEGMSFNPSTGKDADAGNPTPASKYRNEETTPITIELTDPPPAEGYKIELTSK